MAATDKFVLRLPPRNKNYQTVTGESSDYTMCEPESPDCTMTSAKPWRFGISTYNWPSAVNYVAPTTDWDYEEIELDYSGNTALTTAGGTIAAGTKMTLHFK